MEKLKRLYRQGLHDKLGKISGPVSVIKYMLQMKRQIWQIDPITGKANIIKPFSIAGAGSRM